MYSLYVRQIVSLHGRRDEVSLTNKNVEQANFAQVSHELESDYARSQFNYEIEQLYMYRFRDSRAIPFSLLFISFPKKFTLASYT